MTKISYAQYLKETFDLGAKLVGTAGLRSQMGQTYTTHDQTELQVMYQSPGQFRFQEWRPNASNGGKILKGGPKVHDTVTALKHISNRLVPHQVADAHAFIRQLDAAGYRDYQSNLKTPVTES